ncbi:hypothetical protein BMS3Abin03_03186 [bacterium BMS3Abin03]|nr:hypothetical protein BMS3Abin03_03186 [bacterium BMS3Abin03]
MKKRLTYLFLMAALFCVPIISFAQQRDSLIQLYPTLGDTINRYETSMKNLFTHKPMIIMRVPSDQNLKL